MDEIEPVGINYETDARNVGEGTLDEYSNEESSAGEDEKVGLEYWE
jgi:hypothetical protein